MSAAGFTRVDGRFSTTGFTPVLHGRFFTTDFMLRGLHAGTLQKAAIKAAGATGDPREALCGRCCTRPVFARRPISIMIFIFIKNIIVIILEIVFARPLYTGRVQGRNRSGV
jgi:hypothetical protein